MTTKIFAYGTLKKDKFFHDQFLGGTKSAFIGPATTSSDFSLYIDALPSLVREENDKGVKGEVYEVSEEVLKSLDDLEQHPVFYKREVIDLTLADGTKTTAWAYLRPVAAFKGRSGVWREYEFI